MDHITYTLDNAYLLMSSALIFFLLIGLMMIIYAHSVKKNNAHTLVMCLASLVCAGFAYVLIGFNVMYPNEDYFIIDGILGFAGINEPLDKNPQNNLDYNTYNSATDTLFQAMFAAVAALVAIGSLLGRVKISAVIVFTFIFCTVIYPIIGSWMWGGGWQSEIGFVDFAGSGVVFICAGAAGLAGLLVLGPRIGVFSQNKPPQTPSVAGKIPLLTLGLVFIILGMLGFIGGSQLTIIDEGGTTPVTHIVLLCLWVFSVGMLTAILLSYLWHKRIVINYLITATLASFIALCVSPDTSDSLLRYGIVSIVSVVVSLYAHKTIYNFKIDDAAGGLVSTAICAGFVGTVSTTFLGLGQLSTQIIGAGAIFLSAFILSYFAWLLIKNTMGVRVSEEEERDLDATCIGGATATNHSSQPNRPQDNITHMSTNETVPLTSGKKRKRKKKKHKR